MINKLFVDFNRRWLQINSLLNNWHYENLIELLSLNMWKWKIIMYLGSEIYIYIKKKKISAS